uniref:Uncharacterized protein n=1 Tax=Arundo donax TaxID=35708 RepID=A0A0A8ZRU4_ARUDO
MITKQGDNNNQTF